MSRDDYISKLFIKNQDKLQQMPADDLWSKLEQQLDTAADAPVTDVGHAPKQFRLYAFLVAASVVLLFLAGTVVLMPQNNQQMAFELVLEEPTALLVDDAEPYTDDDFILNATVKDEQNEKELVEQEIKIIAAVNKKIEEIAADKVPKEPIVMADITIVDEVDGVVGTSSILIEAEEDVIAIEYAAEETLYKGDTKLNKASLNYAKAVPEIANNVQNSAIAEQVITDERNVELQSNLDFAAIDKESKNYKSRGAIVNKIGQTQDKRSAILSTHPKLHQFEFLLGENIDFYEKEGVSIEKWTIKNNTTLSGRGYKLSSNKEIMFEETLLLKIKHNQVFLMLRFNEKSKTIEYMLSDYDFERFVFSQSDKNALYPDQIVLQRTLNGYTTVMSNSMQMIPSDQQRYLENRNRVTNRGAKRTLNFVD
jgi:hypothetical protein